MAGITLAVAEQKLKTWLSALDSVAAKQSYSINGRSLTYADLDSIQNQVEYWDKQVKRLSRGGIRVRQVRPLG